VVPAEWLSSSSGMSARVTSALTAAYQGLAEPSRARRLRRGLMALAALWAVLALSRLLWTLLPTMGDGTGAPPQVINPTTVSRSAGAEAIDIDRMRAWHLFGKADAAAKSSTEPEPVVQASAREGIEDGARESRLALTLRGIVASTEDGLGHAIIEHKSKQAIYAVEDKLPVSGRVMLAKVMPQQVVLDNGGTYELLMLFDDTKLGGAKAPVPRGQTIKKKQAANSSEIDKRSDQAATVLAENYRERLFDNPQSLAEVVNISAVREGGELLGYRIQPGKEPEQFEQLGFKPGDLVTSVNGIALDNPANTMRLYSAMRSAEEVVFELKREEQPLTISVSLGSVGP
jgi:general secretion pathway protein C